MSLDRKILERIEKEKFRIRPRWFFTAKDMLFGAGTFFLSFLGSLSLALLFEIIKQQGGNLTWLSVPYAWVILLGFFLFGGYWLVSRIDSLYRIRFVPIVSLLFFVSLSFGYLTFASGKAEKMELELEKIPIYDVIVPIKKDISLDVVEKTESNDEDAEADAEDEKSEEGIRVDDESDDSDEDDEVESKERSSFKVEIKEEDADDEIEESDKQDDTDNDDEDSDDSIRGAVKGASKEVSKDEDFEAEESDSDDEMDEDSAEESEAETVEED